MNWTWPTSLDQIWTLAGTPMGLTLAAACFFGVIVVITLLRAEKSVANGALTVITLLAVGIAVASTIRGSGPDGARSGAEARAPMAPLAVAMPALACVDDLAGDLVEAGCEKTLFGSADAAAAAVSYAASMLTRLVAAGDVAAANKAMSPDLMALRRAVEHDRYGLMAYVLLVRDRCTPSNCAAFRSVADRQQLTTNMDARTYEGLVTRYAAQWNAPAPQAGVPALGAIAGLPPSVPTGKPTNADFPSAASTPAVSIMSPEPPARKEPPKAENNSPPAAQTPPPSVAASHAQASAKKSAATKSRSEPRSESRPGAATSLAPPPAAPEPEAPPPSRE